MRTPCACGKGWTLDRVGETVFVGLFFGSLAFGGWAAISDACLTLSLEAQARAWERTHEAVLAFTPELRKFNDQQAAFSKALNGMQTYLWHIENRVCDE